MSLEPTMTKLRRGVNKFEVDNFQGSLLSVGEERLAEGEHPLLGADTGALEHQEVLLHLAVVWEAAHGVDRLVRQVILCGSVVLDQLKRIKLNKKKVSIDRVF